MCELTYSKNPPGFFQYNAVIRKLFVIYLVIFLLIDTSVFLPFKFLRYQLACSYMQHLFCLKNTVVRGVDAIKKLASFVFIETAFGSSQAVQILIDLISCIYFL